MSHSPPLASIRAAGKLKLNKPLTAKKASMQGALPDGARHAMIAEAAYYMAERRGFESGHELDDWLLAERQIDTVTAGADSPRD